MMKIKNVQGIICLVILFLFANQAWADELDTKKKALEIISDHANRICYSVPLHGGSNKVEISGEAKAALTGVAKKLADLGLKGASKYESAEYQGVLQSDLAKTLRNSSDCKKDVYRMLIDRLMPVQMNKKAIKNHTDLLLPGNEATPKEPKLPKKADLGLEFFGRDTITFNFVNFGNETAQSPKYWTDIMDLTTPYSYPQLPWKYQPLPLPAQVLNDFVRHRLNGGVPLLQLNEQTRQHVKLGDKLFGTVHVTCLNCDKTRIYWIFFEVGKGGWYSYDASFPEIGGIVQFPKSDKGSEEIIDAQVPPNQRVVMPETEH
jgi:hypothetical protein